MVPAYLRRLAGYGAAPKGRHAYAYQLRTTLRVAARLASRPVGVGELFADPVLLGWALVADASPASGAQLSRWTLAQRRSALRSFAALMAPELTALLGEDPHAVLDRALRGVAARVGAGYRLSGGAPRKRGGDVPAWQDIIQVIEAVGRAPGFVGSRNRAFFAILAATGARVNAVLGLDGAACVAMPDGRLRLFVHEKGKAAPREVELDRETSAGLRAYAAAFNGHAAARGWRARVRLGEPGPVWRNSGRGAWPYADVLATLRVGCGEAGVPAFAPHALRRAFATDAASALPRHTVALAGGWRGVQRLDDHYVRPREPTIWGKLRSAADRGGEDADPSATGNRGREAALVP